jgi:CheY-like chemotaxis protein
MDRRRKPILVVEDDPVDREMIGQAFKRAAVDAAYGRLRIPAPDENVA